MALASSVLVGATGGTRDGRLGQRTPYGHGPSIGPDLTQVTSTVSPQVKIERVRLESPRRIDRWPSALVKFDLFNDSVDGLTDVVLQISIIEEPAAADGPLVPRVLRASLDAGAFSSGEYKLAVRHVDDDWPLFRRAWK